MNIYPQRLLNLTFISAWILMILIISNAMTNTVKLQPISVQDYITNLNNSFKPVPTSGYRSNLDFPRKFYTNKYQF